MAAEGKRLFLTQSKFAERRGVSRKSVTDWKSKGLLVFSDDGRVDVDASEWNLDQRPAKYRGGVAHRPTRVLPGTKVTGNSTKPAPAAPVPQGAPIELPSRPADSEADDGGAPDATATNLTISEAVRRKENFIGLKHRLEYETAQKEWVRVEDVGALVEGEYATVRERLLVIPGKIAANLVGLDRAAIEDIIRREVTEALNELHGPDISGAGGSGGEDEEGAPGV